MSVAGMESAEPSLMPPRSTLARNGSKDPEPGIESWFFDVDHGQLNHRLNVHLREMPLKDQKVDIHFTLIPSLLPI